MNETFYKVKVWDYDLLEDCENTWTVNDRFEYGEFFTCYDLRYDKYVIKFLKKIGFLKKNLRFKSFVVDGELALSLYVTYCTAKEYVPICELEIMETF